MLYKVDLRDGVQGVVCSNHSVPTYLEKGPSRKTWAFFALESVQSPCKIGDIKVRKGVRSEKLHMIALLVFRHILSRVACELLPILLGVLVELHR
jgi:hypothetical protein